MEYGKLLSNKIKNLLTRKGTIVEKFIVSVPVDYVQGYLKYGHREYTVEAETGEEAIEVAKARGWGEIVVDDYEVEDCGSNDWDEAWADEID